MSRYGVVALLRKVNMDPTALAAYRADPVGFVRDWDESSLTAEEAEMLARKDYAALYASGAHPYLLWSFTEAVWTPELDRADLVERFRTAASSVGYPDPRTTPPPR